MMLKPYVFRNLLEHTGNRNLGELIRKGELVLRGDSPARYNFAFVAGTQPIGLFAITSDGAGKLTMVRAWNRSSFTRDPFTGLDVPCSGAQFEAVAADVLVNSPTFFLIEFNQDWSPARKIAFKAREAAAYFCEVEGMPPELKFEALDLARLEILG
jgi:hypothetical protein